MILDFLLPIIFPILSFFVHTPYESSAAVLLRANGNVQYKPSENVAWTKGTRGTKLNPNSILKTGNSSFAVIVFSDKSTIKLRNNTEVKVLGSVSSEGDYSDREIRLNTGSIGFDVIAKPAKPFRFISATATASIKGTEGVVSVNSAQTEFALVDSENNNKEVGEIKSLNSDQIEPVSIGEKATASSESVTEKRKLREDELRDLRNQIVQRRSILKRELESVRFKIREEAERIREDREEIKKRMEEERRNQNKQQGK